MAGQQTRFRPGAQLSGVGVVSTGYSRYIEHSMCLRGHLPGQTVSSASQPCCRRTKPSKWPMRTSVSSSLVFPLGWRLSEAAAAVEEEHAATAILSSSARQPRTQDCQRQLDQCHKHDISASSNTAQNITEALKQGGDLGWFVKEATKSPTRQILTQADRELKRAGSRLPSSTCTGKRIVRARRAREPSGRQL